MPPFEWSRHPEADQLVRGLVDGLLSRCAPVARLAEAMREQTGTRFFDWVDHLVLPVTSRLEQELLAAGFVSKSVPGAVRCLVHEGGMFPRVLLGEGAVSRVAIKVESVTDFLCAWHVPPAEPTEGAPLSPLRRARAFEEDGVELWVIERHGHRGFDLPEWSARQSALALRHAESFRRRQRDFSDDVAGFIAANRLIDAAVADLGVGYACDLFFAAEREYWQRRNRAGQMQKARQDRLGLGWANHDHHTYRSSREHFSRLILTLEKLGFVCRERFYAGAEAGWGAQVLEQTDAGVVVFADVDLSPDEVLGDFARNPLSSRDELGTVGLWCGLHGEAFLQAGMHHLEAQFDFDVVREQLESREDVHVMKPFTDFPHLRQAFTEGERWPVREGRIARLLDRGLITHEQAESFRRQGAIGSHLENLERNEGFKGFNQRGISQIISHTDPRRQNGA
ncbi:MAG: hypothetical protein ACREIT_08925 [Tepidisphaeraceae bacterium]